MFSNYYEVRDWLEGFIPLVYTKENLGFTRITYFLKLLDNPERKFKSVHIAGTSGKGSTAFYIAKLLQCSKSEIPNPKSETNSKFKNANSQKVLNFGNSNFDIVSSFDISASNFPTKVGLHVSPHLIDIRERMQIFRSGKWKVESGKFEESLMSMGRFLQLMNEIRSVVEKIQKTKPDLTPSYFEILVAATFKYFAQERVDWAVVEVGLGGRLDATNVLQPELTLITNVGLDHTEILGKTIEKIAEEKAGIIKSGVPVITGATERALKVIEKAAEEKGSKVIKIDTQKLAKELSMQSYSTGPFLAYALLKQLKIPIKKESAKKVFSLKFPGRFEEIGDGIIIDGAHNPDKIRFLIKLIKKTFDIKHWSRFLTKKTFDKEKKKSIVNCQLSIVLVIAFKKGKNWKKMVDLLVKNLPVREVIATKYQAVTDTGKGSAVEPQEIRRYLISNFKFQISNVKLMNNSQEAVFEAIQNTKYKIPNTSLVLVTGSLYLVGEVRTMWRLPTFT